VEREVTTMRSVRRPRVWSWRELRGEPHYLHGLHITPISRAVTLRWPGGGLLWQWPLAVEVREGKRAYRRRIPDATRRTTIALLLLAAALLLGSAALRRQRTHHNRQTLLEKASAAQ
jgi:hypothetical protein